MRWFGWRKRQQQEAAVESSTQEPGTADTFVDATGGGWGESPQSVATDGGSQADYVRSLLEQASEEARSVEVGDEFTFTITEIPRGITGPFEIVFGLITLAGQYGLEFAGAINEEVTFKRTR